MPDLLHRARRILWPPVAGAIVLLALLSTILQVLVPGLDSRRQALEGWISSHLQTEVRIGKLSARWVWLWPQVTATDVRIAPDGATGGAIVIPRLDATLALLPSLQAREPVLKRLELEGLSLAVARNAAGQFDIVGLPLAHHGVLAWLLRQTEVRVRKAALRVVGATPEATLAFEQLSLRLTQAPEGALLEGAARGMTPLGDAPAFELHWPLNDAAAPELRLRLQHAPVAALAAWLQRPGLAGLFADLNGRAWLRFGAQGLTRVALDAQFALAEARRTPGFSQLILRGVASHTPAGWQIALRDLAPGPSLDDGNAHPAALSWSGDQWLLTAQRLPLDLLALLPGPHDTLDALAPRGELQQVRAGLRLVSDTSAGWFAAATLQHASTRTTGDWPAVEGLAADFAANAQGGVVRLAPDTLRFEHAERLEGPVVWQSPAGVYRWVREGEAWQVSAQDVAGTLQGLPLAASATARWQPGVRPSVDLEAELGPGPAAPLATLLPKALLHEHGDHWLRAAFPSGQLQSLSLALHGDLARFPFDAASDGEFRLDFAITDAELHYSDHWPAIFDVAGHGSLKGRELQATLTRARFVDSPADDVTLRIPDVFSHDPRLYARGRVHTSLADTRTTLDASPLQEGLGKRLHEFDLDGPFDLTLDLDLGLRHDATRTAHGTLVLRQNHLSSPRQAFALEAVDGEIRFGPDGWRGEDLSARFDGQPVQVRASGGKATDATTLELAGQLDADGLRRTLAHWTPGVHRWLDAAGQLEAFSGATDWHARLSLPPAIAGEPAPVQLRVDSPLAGLAVALPWPFAKTAGETRAFTLETTFARDAPRTTRLALDGLATLTFQQATAAGNGALASLDVALGPDEPVQSVADAIHLHGRAASLALAAWAPLFSSQAPGMGLPLTFDLGVEDLDVLGQHFGQLRLRGEHRVQGWQVTIEGEQAAGTLRFDPRAATSSLVLDLERLRLTPAPPDAPRPRLDPRTLPALTLRCRSFRYGEIDFGNTLLDSVRVAAGQRLQAIEFRNPAFTLKGKGTWLMPHETPRSQFSLELAGESLGRILGTFGYAGSAIEGGKARLDIEASWAGMPSEFRLSALDGAIGLKVEEGRFLDIEPGSGRFFGLLSLQTLPRRLSLDFADLFSKGFAFDRIEGWFKLEQGNAYTNSLLMEGPSAKIEVSGRTGLAAQDYDQHAIVTPALSASLPIAGALFGPAGVGVGAALYLGQQVFKAVPEQVDRFLRREYTITGSWREPKVEKR